MQEKFIISIVPWSESLVSLLDSLCHGLDLMTDYLDFDMWIFVGIRDVLAIDFVTL